MADLTAKQKKDWARTLYLKENLTQQEISDRVGVSRQTVIRWMQKEKWEDLKTSFTLTREEQIRMLYRQVAEINKTISEKPEGERFATSKEADIIGKLAAAIDKMETDVGIKDMCEVGAKFKEWLRVFDLNKAKEFVVLFDAFVEDHL
ncbi:MAG TPA: DDE transposase family protein [Porphyromonadaceae bacterium]|nr:DDE transposase family protein [Porphyromonadaceae bacterium]